MRKLEKPYREDRKTDEDVVMRARKIGSETPNYRRTTKKDVKACRENHKNEEHMENPNSMRPNRERPKKKC